MHTLPPIREMERAVQTSDASYDGLFVVAVRTTHIYCKPSCPAHKPFPKHCIYFATAEEAEAEGYRACKRCRPQDAVGRPPEWAARLLAAVEDDPAARWRDADLRALGIDPARVRRYFRRHYGMTFQTYCRRRRMGEALHQIRAGADLDAVTLGNGYESHSGFRDAFARTFGRPPGRSRKADCVVTARLESPLGPLTVAATDDAVCLIEFAGPRSDDQAARLQRLFGCAVVPGRHALLDQLRDELAAYFAGRLQAFRVPIVYPGTPFQAAVWRQLLKIPYGETCSYKDIARAVGAPTACRAVGAANGRNRLVIVIPCHRVVNEGGRLGGYGGGLWRKQYLLDLERRALQGCSFSRGL
jgi:AraC family transcriptional regulator of adaptative response/methylated-DNA-[protein]-cysteine methyltransferase